MRYRQMGSSGLRVSAIGLGTNQFGGKCDAEQVKSIIHTAIDQGVTLLDTADIYRDGRSEETIGAAIHDRRDRVILATKVGMKTGDGPNDVGASRFRIYRQVEASLRRLRTDHIDLYQIHQWDPTTPIEETLRALDDLVRAGKVRYVGASNFTAAQLADANALARSRGWSSFVTVQPEYSMLVRDIEQDLIPHCEEHGVGILPYFPLAGGFLTGKYRRGKAAPPGSRGENRTSVQKYMVDSVYDRVEKWEAWARKRDHSLGELAHAWLLSQPSVCSVISGATTPEHVKANVTEWELTPEEREEVNSL